jgi:hypothetical protein
VKDPAKDLTVTDVERQDHDRPPVRRCR